MKKQKRSKNIDLEGAVSLDKGRVISFPKMLDKKIYVKMK